MKIYIERREDGMCFWKQQFADSVNEYKNGKLVEEECRFSFFGVGELSL